MKRRRARRSEVEELTASELALIERRRVAEKAARTARKNQPKPSGRGFRGPAGGQFSSHATAPEWRASTRQVCGLWPFAGGSGSPITGVPLGRHQFSGGTLCCDPVSWFQRARLIGNPSVFVLGLPALGKSTLIRRMCLGLEGMGVMPMVLGDLKPDYVDMGRAIGAQVISLGRGRGSLNVLDPGEADAVAARLTGTAKERLVADAHGRKVTMVGALLTIQRQQPPTHREETVIDRAVSILEDRHEGTPVLADLLQVIQDAPEDLRYVALDRGDKKRYQELTEDLEAALIGLVSGGRLGTTFSRPTSEPMRHDKPVVFDISSITDTEADLQAATLLACWSYGFASINAAHALADAGLAPQRNYFVVMDELWRALRAGQGMVDRVDALSRLNRQHGVGQAMISHTMADLRALADEHDRQKAAGLVERSGMVICGGLPRSEMPRLRDAVRLSRAEEALLEGWSSPPTWGADGVEAEPPGRGRFLVKVGGRPGIPFRVELTPEEEAINDTNKRWHGDTPPLVKEG